MSALPSRPLEPNVGPPASSLGTHLLVVSDLAKAYQGVHAVDGVSFSVPRNAIVGIIGPNGSGKSTTIDCVTGFQKPDRGTVLLDGQDIGGHASWQIARAGLMRTFQNVRVYESLSLIDNLLVAMQAFDKANPVDALFRTPRLRSETMAAEARAAELIALVGLERYAQMPVGILSYGQKKLVALSSALMSKPRLVVLDEPVAGVNPSRIREIEAAIRALRDAGETFLIVEHNIEFIMNLCDHVVVFDQGAKLTEGPPVEVHADPRVLEAYLGVRA
ncbi:MAG: ABC transporter ATP-binding protein [Pseudomonadota bacterium]|nr:ABC transporter ATP-binding protein [Pseudomonadota bacterium]